MAPFNYWYDMLKKNVTAFRYEQFSLILLSLLLLFFFQSSLEIRENSCHPQSPLRLIIASLVRLCPSERLHVLQGFLIFNGIHNCLRYSLTWQK